MTREMSQRLECAYDYMYNDQQEGATEDYLTFLKTEFAPPDKIDWSREDVAIPAVRSIIAEICESCVEPDEVMEAAGIDEDVLIFLGL